MGCYEGFLMIENQIYEPTELLYLKLRMNIGMCRVKELQSLQINSLHRDVSGTVKLLLLE